MYGIATGLERGGVGERYVVHTAGKKSSHGLLKQDPLRFKSLTVFKN